MRYISLARRWRRWGSEGALIIGILVGLLLVSVIHVQVVLILESMLIMPKTVCMGVIRIACYLVRVRVIKRWLMVSWQDIFFVVELIQVAVALVRSQYRCWGWRCLMSVIASG